MHRGDVGNILGVIVIVALLFIAAFLMPLLFLLYVVLIAATVVFAGLFLPRFRLLESRVPPEQLLGHLAYKLRGRGYRIEETPMWVTIRLGSIAAIRIHIRPTPRGSEVRYQAYATPSGWGTLITLIVIVWTAPVAIFALIYLFVKIRRFAQRQIGPFVQDTEGLPALPPPDDVRVLLVNSLSEGHRLASEAYEAQRSAYQDSLALCAFVGFMAWALLLITLFFTLPRESGPGMWLLPLGIATVSAVGATLLIAGVIRRRALPRILDYRNWAERLRTSLSRESARIVPEPAEPSVFELLVGASQEIPAWLEAKRKAGMSGDQASGWVVFVLSLVSLLFFWMAFDYAFVGLSIVVAAFAAAGVALAFGAYLYWNHWRREQQATMARALSEWRRRTELLQARLAQFFQDM